MTNERVYYSHDAEVQAMRDRSMQILVFMALGLAAGVALTLLLAPRSGQKTRDGIAKNVEEGLHTGRDKMEPVLKRLEEEFADLRKNVEDRLK